MPARPKKSKPPSLPSQSLSFNAVRDNKPDTLRAFIDALPHATFPAKNSLGARLVRYAATHGRDTCLGMLLHAGATPNSLDSHNETPLLLAVAARSAACLTLLIQAGANIHAQGHEGYTPAFAAASDDYPEGLRLLLDAGVSPNSTGPQGAPLIVAAVHNSPDCTRLLLEAGASVDCKGLPENYLVHAAIQPHSGPYSRRYQYYHPDDRDTHDDHFSYTVLNMLIHAGCDIDSPDKDGNAPLHLVSQGNHGPMCLNLLLVACKNIDARDASGMTPLMLSIRYGSEAKVAAIALAGADVLANDPEGFTARGHLEHHGDIHNNPRDQRTDALLLALEEGLLLQRDNLIAENVKKGKQMRM